MVESFSDVTEIISKIKNDKNTKIISFDMLAHDNLSKLGIDHEKVENYIDIDDQKMIDQLSLDISMSWYKHEEISKFLQFDNMNLGWLLEEEIIPYFLQVMKSFIGIIRIIATENPSTITASDFLCTMIKSVDKDNRIVIYPLITKKTSQNLDRIFFPLSIGKKSFTLRIPSQFALKIARMVEHLTSIIFNFRVNFQKTFDKGTILLLNLNPNPYDLFLQSLSRLNRNIVLLYESGSAVWNIKNLKIVKSSGLKIIHLRDLLNPKLKLQILTQQKEIRNNLHKMSLNDELYTIFSVEGHSFWSSIKERFLSICYQRFEEAIERFELSKVLFAKINVKSIICLYNSNPEEKVILHVSKKQKIPSIVLLHGYCICGKYHAKIVPTVFPILQKGIMHALWGSIMKNYLCQFDTVDEKDMIIAGNPRYDQYFKMKNDCKNTGTILIASSFLQNYYEVSRFDTNFNMLHQKMFREICLISKNISSRKTIIKLHPGVKPSYDVKSIIDKIDPNIPIYKTQNIIDLLKDCDVLVSLDHTTVLLEAMILGKPTIIFAINPSWYDDDEMVKSGATVVVKTPEEFKTALDKVLFDNEFRKDLIQKGSKFVNEYVANQGNASEFLAKVLGNY